MQTLIRYLIKIGYKKVKQKNYREDVESNFILLASELFKA